MAFEKGEFVLLEYVAKVKETNEVFDTTNQETAKKEHLYKEGEIYEPKLVVIGEKWVLEMVDENLLKMEISKSATVEIAPDKAFGARDPEKVRRVPLKQLTAKGINPSLGMRVEFNDKMATVRAMGAGRVLLDFNPPLAGKTLVYEVTVQKKLETKEEKIAALIHRRVPVIDEDKFEFEVKTKAVNIEMPEDAFYIEGIQVAKRGIALDIQKFFPEVTAVKFSETFKTEPKETKKSEVKTETKTEEEGTETKT
jgi:peptidylprolyl isomerase